VKCHQCEKPSLFEMNGVPLCLDCSSKLQRILDMQLLTNAMGMNQALDDMDMISGFVTPGGRMPVKELARAMQGSPTFNNITLNNSQVGVLNTGQIARIDAAITLTQGSDLDAVGRHLQAFVELLAKSDLDDADKAEVIDLVESMSGEIVGKRKPATIVALMKAIAEKVGGVLTLVKAADGLWGVIKQAIGL
jgi:hypothetical protein